MYNLMDKSCLFIVDTLYHQSIFCIILFILIFCISKIVKGKSPHWQLGLWFIILIRLVLPTDLSFSFSARNLVDDFIVADNFNASLEKVSDRLIFNNQPNQNSELSTPIRVEGKKGVIKQAAWEANKDKPKYLFWPVILSIFWLLGSLTLLFLFLYKIRSIKRVLSHSSLVLDKEIITFVDYWRKSFKITRRVLIYSSDKFLSPFTIGLFRPKIFIPGPLLEGMDKESINSIIAHEMVHIKHFDHVWLRLQNVLQIIYFFNPVVWYASRQINIARECLCDSVVLEKQVIPPKTFGKSVIDVLKFNVSGYSRIEPLLCFNSHKKIFEYRIKDIVKEKTTSKKKPLYIFLMVCLLGLFLLPMSNAKIDITKPEIIDTSPSTITEKSQADIEPDKVIAEVQDDGIAPPELDDRNDGITDQKEKVEVESYQASTENIKKHEEPLKLASIKKKVISSESKEKPLGLVLSEKKADSPDTKIHEPDKTEPEPLVESSVALQQRQDAPVDYTDRGRSHLKDGQIDDALSDLNKAIALNPENAVAYFSRGNAYYLKGKFDKVISDYNKAIEINPRYTNAYFSRGRYYQAIEEYRKAISDYSRVISIHPDNAVAYFSRGNAYYLKGKISKAISDYTKAIDLNPRYTNAYFSRGYYYQMIEEYSKAISDYSKVISIHPENAYTYNYRGSAYFIQEKYQKAFADFDKAIALDPGYASAYVYRGYYYHMMGEYRSAVADYKKALELNPEIALVKKLLNESVQISKREKKSAEQNRNWPGFKTVKSG